MLKIETVNQFLGFGEDGNKRGEYMFSRGMHAIRDGIEPWWNIRRDAAGTTIAQLDRVYWFTERNEGGNPYVYAVDEGGDILRTPDLVVNWAFFKTPVETGHGNGLIVDHSQSQRLLFIQDEFVGYYDGAVWDSQWKDLGWSVNVPKGPDIYEDWVVIPNSSTVALLNIRDDSFTYSGFTLPPDFVVRALKSGQNGVLIGVNSHYVSPIYFSKGVLILWDCQTDRSIAPWIWVEGKIYAIAKYKGIWLVITDREVLLTNGYRIIKSYKRPESERTHNPGPYPGAVMVEGDLLFIGGALNPSFIRRKQGVHILNLITGLWEFAPIPKNLQTNLNLYSNSGVGALFRSSNNQRYISYEESFFDADDYLGRIYLSPKENIESYFITPKVGSGNQKKKAEAIILDLSYSFERYQTFANPDWEIKVKLYDLERPLWGYSLTSMLSTARDLVIVDATVAEFAHAQIGDEVTVLEGRNGGEIRHIRRIDSTATATEYWWLDSDLSYLTELYAYLNLAPFKLVGEKTITQQDIIQGRVFIPVKNKLVGRKFLIKVTAKLGENEAIPHFGPIQFVYDELGYE